MRYFPRLSLSVWALLALLAGSSVVCLSPAWSADQKPLVINPTTGRTEQMQTGNNLTIPGSITAAAIIRSTAASGAAQLRIDSVDSTAAIATNAVYCLGGIGVTGALSTGADASGVGFYFTAGTAIRTRTANATDTIFVDAPRWHMRDSSNGFADVLWVDNGVVTVKPTTGTTLTVSSTTDSTSKDTGSMVTEGGLGVEKTIVGGGNLSLMSQNPTLDVGNSTGVPVLRLLGANASQAEMRFYNASVAGYSVYRAPNDTNLNFYQAGTINKDVLLLSASGNVTTSGNLIISEAGDGVSIKEGTNAKMGVATLVGGTLVVNTTTVTANSRIFLTAQSLGTVAVASGYAITARTAATSFTITASQPTDTSVIAWMIVEPAP